MGKKYKVTNDHGDTIDVELDDDIEDAELEPTPDNALSDDEIAAIEADENTLGE